MSNNLPGDDKAELRQMTQQLARIVEISLTLNSTLEIDQLLQFILDTAVSLLDCQAASIMLCDEHDQHLYFAASTDPDSQQLTQIPIPLEGSLAGAILQGNRPIVVNDVQGDPRHFKAVSDQTKFDVRSLLGVPMLIQERATGVLEALNKNAGAFTAQDAELLSIIANQAAVAINNANLVQALQKANQELSQLDKLKSDFMAVASHELRTPLGIILGYAEFLKDAVQADLSSHAASVLKAAIRLQTLVESMTNMNLLYARKADLNLQPVEIQEIIGQAYRDVISTAEARNNDLVLELGAEPVFVNADPKLQWVFVNVLNNAVRFTPDPGEIFVTLQAENEAVLITIEDGGIGIPADELEKIFDQFYQVEDHLTRRFGGLGLGLAIARALTELHGGRIWAESDGPGLGARFNILLPVLVEG